MIYIFQKEFKIIVLEAEDMDMPVFCALTNSNVKFIGGLRNLIEKVQRIGIISEEDTLTVGIS